MKYNIYGKNFDLTGDLKDFIYKQFETIEDFFEEDTVAKISVIQGKKYQKFEATINYKGKIIRVEKESDDIYTAIPTAISVIEKQIEKYQDKINRKSKNNEEFNIKETLNNIAIQNENNIENEDGTEDEHDIFETDINIKKEKEFIMRPMTIEDACIQLELLGHEFYMFLNVKTGKYNVIYKRKDLDGYGLISPA